MIFEWQQVVVAVSAGDAEGGPLTSMRGPGNLAGVDGVAQSNVGVAAGADVADGGESGFDSDLGILCAGKRFRRDGDAELFVSELGIAGDVGVHVDQSGKNGAWAVR